MRGARALLVAATTASTIVGLAAGPVAASAAAGAGFVGVPNPSFDEGWLDGKPKCWNVSSTSNAKLTITKNAHSGAWAGHVAGQAPANSELTLATDRTDACRLPVTAGRRYTLGLWTRSTSGVRAVVSSFSAAGGWKSWFRGASVPATSDLRHYAIDLPAVPAGVTQLSVGLAFAGDSTVVLDDVELAERDTVLFKPTFGASGLVTNEFTYWNPTDPKRAESPDWEMTSGSLFARNGGGYSGAVDDGSPDARSATTTGSSIFRLNTRNYSFGDVQVSMKLNIASLTSTIRTPTVDWDGVHIFLHYQSQYELYYASVARRDGHVVIKKKCLGGPSNGGAYYALGHSEISGMKFPLDTWQEVGATVRTNADGSVTLTLQRNGKDISSATDTGIGCAPISAAGATGIRGDNTEFQFSDFTVTELS